MLKNFYRRLSVLFGVLALTISVNGQIVLQPKEPPVEMENLDFLIGRWENAESEWYDMEGNPTVVKRGKEFKKTSFNQILPIMGGLYLEGGGDGDFVRAYYFYHSGEDVYYHIAMDFRGSLSIMTGSWKNEILVFHDIKPQKYKSKDIIWRRTFYNIKADSHSFKYEFSIDGGNTWSLRGKQAVQRFEPLESQASYSSKELLSQLEPFFGNWYNIPDSSTLANFQEQANSIGFKFEWGREDKNILKFYEGVREGKIEKAILDCSLAGNPRTGEIEFQGYQNMNNFLYKGIFDVHEGGRGFTREYDVYYPEGTKFNLKEDRALGMKTYRDVCQLIGVDTLECITEQLDRGKWNPWGRGEKYLMVKKPVVGAAIPEWVIDHWKGLARGSGMWIADNSKYVSTQEPYEAYGLEWKHGLGGKHLTGRLYCLQNGIDVGSIWQFTEYWDPIAKKLSVVQIGSDGTLGNGQLYLAKDGKMKEEQIFVSPGRGVYNSGHEAWMNGDDHHTTSFNIVNEIWEERRSYIWKLKSEKEHGVPDEFRELSHLIGTWECAFDDNTARMIFTWGENKRAIRFENSFKPGKNAEWRQENEGIITYNGVLKKPVFITSYTEVGSQLMAEGVFSFDQSGKIHREFNCHYSEGQGLPWSDGAKAPMGGQTIQFKQIWTILGEDELEDEFLWFHNGKWEHPITHDQGKFKWRKIN